jgi:hypothetical protein
MGTSIGIQKLFGLHILIPRIDGLKEIVIPFSTEGMDVVVSNIPLTRLLNRMVLMVCL